MSKEKLQNIKGALRAKGIRIHVGGGGCCRSPWMALEVDGKMIVGEILMNGEVAPRGFSGRSGSRRTWPASRAMRISRRSHSGPLLRVPAYP